MGSTNYGTQDLKFDYLNPLESPDFNKLNLDIIPTGVYTGNELSISSSTTVTIQITGGVLYIRNNTNTESSPDQSLRCETTDDNFNITIDSSTPYIIARLTWASLENNYVDFMGVSASGIETNDIILGKILFTGAVADDISYEQTNYSDLIQLKNNLSFQVTKNDLSSDTSSVINVQSGKALLNNIYINYAGGTETLTSSVTSGMISIVVVDSTGAMSIRESSDTSSPTIPTVNSDELLLATITRDAGVTGVRSEEIESYHNLLKQTLGFQYVDDNFVYKTGSVAENITGIKTFSNTTDATSKSTGGVILSGGLGVTKNIYSGQRFINDNALYNSFFGNCFNLSSTGSNNSAVGYESLFSCIDGSDNSAFGYHALYSNTYSGNSAFGYNSLSSNTSGIENVAFGYESLRSNVSNDRNSAFGYESLYLNTQHNNSAFGSYSLRSNTTGGDNSAFGNNSLFSNSVGFSNSAFGNDCLKDTTTGSDNSAFGDSSLRYNSTGSNNSAFGSYSLRDTTGSNNSAFGYYSLRNTTGADNSAFGYYSLQVNEGGDKNSAFGYESLSSTSSDGNSAFGYQAGNTLTNGSYNTFIGYNAQPNSATATGEFVLGDSNVTVLRCEESSISSLSDKRDKSDIVEIENSLNFINDLKPVTWKWNKREWYNNGDNSDESKKQEKLYHGFLAQDLQTTQKKHEMEWMNLVYEANPEKLEIAPSKLITVLVKAIQELSFDNNELKTRLNELEDSL